MQLVKGVFKRLSSLFYCMLILMSIIAYNSIIGHDRHIKFNLTFEIPGVKLLIT